MVDDEADVTDEDDPPRPTEVWAVLIEGTHEDKVRPAVVMADFTDRIEVVYGWS